MHQYDCFNTDRPPCEGATPLFHEECVGPKRETLEGRLFDTVDAQIARNGDTGKRLVMKMDVEGSEWPSLLSMSDAALQQIDQLSVEFHGVEEGHYADTMKHLARFFYVVNIHYNNWTCSPDVKPFHATTFELLLVNKSIGVVEPGGAPVIPNPLDSPNNWMRPDCQAARRSSPPVAPASPEGAEAAKSASIPAPDAAPMPTPTPVYRSDGPRHDGSLGSCSILQSHPTKPPRAMPPMSAPMRAPFLTESCRSRMTGCSAANASATAFSEMMRREGVLLLVC